MTTPTLTGSYAVATQIAEVIAAEGVPTTTDPRGATPPCVLVFVEQVTYDGMATGTGVFQIFALAPGPANIDAWAALEDLERAIRRALPVEGYRTIRYPLDGTGTPVLAYLFTYTQGIDL